MKTNPQFSSPSWRRRGLQAILLCALLMPGAAVVNQSREPVGRAVSVRGAVFAQAPGEERRILECRDPIFAGDRVLTLDGSAVGIDSSTYYARLGENTVVEFGALANGSPRVDLVDGHVRLIDSAGNNAESAELLTPGLRVSRTGPDQDALVFREKAGVVSMVCAYSEPVNVARRTDGAQLLVAAPSGCVVGKPREPLYAANASHPQLAVLMRDACEELALVPVSARFSPDDVALGPNLTVAGAGSGAPPPVPPPFGGGPGLPCSGGCAGSGGPTPTSITPTGTPGPSNFPFVPIPGLPAPVP
jgi:hypothetical protein